MKANMLPLRLRNVAIGRFFQSIANDGREPTAYDVLACITKSDPGSFENFCSEYGYDNDLRRAENVYRAVLGRFKRSAVCARDYAHGATPPESRHH